MVCDMIKNIIFIDCDGILNTVKCPNNCLSVFKQHSCPCDIKYGIDDNLRDRFIDFVKKCPENTQFVLVSSWRKEPRLLRLFEFTFNSIITQYAGYIDNTLKDEALRPNAIIKWLHSNIREEDYCNYVIFDDRHYFIPEKDNLKGLKMHIIPYAGLSELHCNLALDFLNGKEINI